jgi:hypothetical protein
VEKLRFDWSTLVSLPIKHRTRVNWKWGKLSLAAKLMGTTRQDFWDRYFDCGNEYDQLVVAFCIPHKQKAISVAVTRDFCPPNMDPKLQRAANTAREALQTGDLYLPAGLIEDIFNLFNYGVHSVRHEQIFGESTVVYYDVHGNLAEHQIKVLDEL